MIAILLITTLISGYNQQVQSDPIGEYLVAVGRKMSTQDAGLADTIRSVFYDRRLIAQERGDYPMMALIAEIAKMEMSLHKYEQEALSVAAHMIMKTRMDEISDALANLTVSRLIHQVSISELDLEQTRRKKIYLLLRSYDHKPGIKQLALEYCLRIKGKETRALKARAILDEALQRYQGRVSGVLSGLNQSQMLQLVDKLIKSAKASPISTDERNALNAWMLTEIAEASREAVGKVMQFPPEAIEAVRMDDVLQYEDAYAQSHLDAVMENTYNKLIEQDERFKKTIKEVFHEPQEMAKVEGNKGLMALSARIAVSETLMYAIEDRMMIVVREAIKLHFIHRYRQLEGNLIAESNLIDLIMRRSLERAIQSGFIELEDYRKEIYWLLKKYGQSEAMKDLARKFFASLRFRKRLQSDANRDGNTLLRKYINDVSLVLPEPEVSQISRDVDQFIDEALERSDFVVLRDGLWKKSAQLDRNHLVKQYVKEELYEAMMAARRVESMDTSQIESVDMKDVLANEDLILAT